MSKDASPLLPPQPRARALRLEGFALTALALLITTNVSAKDLPSYNACDDQRPVTPVLPPSARTLARGVATSLDEQRGVPSFLWAGPSPSRAASPLFALASHEQAARLHLKRVAPIYGVSDQALATA